MPGVEIKLEPTETTGDKVDQRLRFSAAKPQEGVKLVLRGTLAGSEEAFPAETDGAAQKRFPLVRNSVGLSRNRRNNAVYDRRWDWVLTGPGDGATRIQPTEAEKQRITFTLESRGASLDLVFRPRFYQKHRELSFFEPWTYQAWKGPVTGYCTWWSYRDGIDQKTLDALVGVFSEKKLPDFGYRYFQIDAGYCGGGGDPQSFLEWNRTKFPGGATDAIAKIRSAGMKPGIWVHRVYRSYVDRYLPQIGKEHPDWFVTKADGTILQGSYGVWCLNTRSKTALDAMVRPLFRGLRQEGWDYVKIGWARIDLPGMPINQTFSAPTELTLRTTDDGIRLFAAPIRELEQLRKPNPQTVSGKELTAATPAVEFDVADQLLDIVVTLRKGTASQAVLRFGENVVTYDFGAQKLEDMPLKMQDSKVMFRVLVDRPMYEAVGGGACFKTEARRDMGKPLGKISLTARGGSLTIESFTAHEMTSAWKNR